MEITYAPKFGDIFYADLIGGEHKLSQKYSLKHLAASEPYWVKDRTEKDNTNCHIFIAAKNERGRRALNDALSEANITGFYGRPRLDISFSKWMELSRD